jgi:pimeloyl-ACP methyl ester carboxylesterase
MTPTQRVLTFADVGPVDLTVDDRGDGPPFLLLHGGAGPQSVAGFADLLVNTRGARVITPTHPGFGGTPRPDALNSVARLAALYVELLAQLELRDVAVFGNSIGGWIAAEVALQDPSRLRSLVLAAASGIEVPEHPLVDFFNMTPDELAQLSYHDPDKFRIDPSTLPPAIREAMPGNRAAVAAYGGTSLSDPTLLSRLGGITTPTLVVWGESDGMLDADYGRTYAAAIPGSDFHLLKASGHVPQIETPDQLLEVVWEFVDADASNVR